MRHLKDPGSIPGTSTSLRQKAFAFGFDWLLQTREKPNAKAIQINWWKPDVAQRVA